MLYPKRWIDSVAPNTKTNLSSSPPDGGRGGTTAAGWIDPGRPPSLASVEEAMMGAVVVDSIEYDDIDDDDDDERSGDGYAEGGGALNPTNLLSPAFDSEGDFRGYHERRRRGETTTDRTTTAPRSDRNPEGSSSSSSSSSRRTSSSRGGDDDARRGSGGSSGRQKRRPTKKYVVDDAKNVAKRQNIISGDRWRRRQQQQQQRQQQHHQNNPILEQFITDPNGMNWEDLVASLKGKTKKKKKKKKKKNKAHESGLNSEEKEAGGGIGRGGRTKCNDKWNMHPSRSRSLASPVGMSECSSRLTPMEEEVSIEYDDDDDEDEDEDEDYRSSPEAGASVKDETSYDDDDTEDEGCSPRWPTCSGRDIGGSSSGVVLPAGRQEERHPSSRANDVKLGNYNNAEGSGTPPPSNGPKRRCRRDEEFGDRTGGAAPRAGGLDLNFFLALDYGDDDNTDGTMPSPARLRDDDDDIDDDDGPAFYIGKRSRFGNERRRYRTAMLCLVLILVAGIVAPIIVVAPKKRGNAAANRNDPAKLVPSPREDELSSGTIGGGRDAAPLSDSSDGSIIYYGPKGHTASSSSKTSMRGSDAATIERASNEAVGGPEGHDGADASSETPPTTTRPNIVRVKPSALTTIKSSNPHSTDVGEKFISVMGGKGENRVSFLRFDLSLALSGNDAEVVAATLELHLTSVKVDPTNSIRVIVEVLPRGGKWLEGTVSWKDSVESEGMYPVQFFSVTGSSSSPEQLFEVDVTQAIVNPRIEDDLTFRLSTESDKRINFASAGWNEGKAVPELVLETYC